MTDAHDGSSRLPAASGACPARSGRFPLVRSPPSSTSLRDAGIHQHNRLEHCSADRRVPSRGSHASRLTCSSLRDQGRRRPFDEDRGVAPIWRTRSAADVPSRRSRLTVQEAFGRSRRRLQPAAGELADNQLQVGGTPRFLRGPGWNGTARDFLVGHDLVGVFQVIWAVLHGNVCMYGRATDREC